MRAAKKFMTLDERNYRVLVVNTASKILSGILANSKVAFAPGVGGAFQISKEAMRHAGYLISLAGIAMETKPEPPETNPDVWLLKSKLKSKWSKAKNPKKLRKKAKGKKK